MAAAGVTIDPAWKLDGVNLMPFLTGADKGRPHETLYWRFGEQWAIRKGDWKLVASAIDPGKQRLINLADDISEAKDLSAKNPEKVKELKEDWLAWNAQQMEPLWAPASREKKKDNAATQPATKPQQD
jgi:arylsulfatase A-like enzyme